MRHGMSDTRLYCIWESMKARCYRKTIKGYQNYGGRGIKVCDKWQTFTGFYEDMADTYADGLTLDRLDNDGDYCPDNCRWATQKEQQNHRRNNVHIDYLGRSMTLAEVSAITGIKYHTLYSRYYRITH